ncbi:hypothetical protein [Kiloniella sp. b19]|uniref:hypothetical protein n=1 Tax=Kiloniella sp. GXU_MW_B19 TaxID=3141326 RepID=UPI0031D5CB45
MTEIKTLQPDEAIELLKKGRTEWNLWVRMNPEHNISFEGVNFPTFIKPVWKSNPTQVIKEINFQEYEFPKGDILFTRANFGDYNVSFSGAKFRAGQVSFEYSIFNGPQINFTGTRFGDSHVIFSGAQFGGRNVSFNDAQFGEGNIIFSRVSIKKGNLSFDDAEFNKSKLSFGAARLGEADITFINATFEKATINFWGAKSEKGNTLFPHAKFKQSPALFDEMEFGDGIVSFVDAEFEDETIRFQRTKFGKGGVSFVGAKFGKGEISFAGAKFGEGDLAFEEAKFGESKIDFIGAEFRGRVIFSDLLSSEKIKQFSFRGASFNKSLELNGNRFSCIPDLTNTKINNQIVLRDSEWEFSYETLKDPQASSKINRLKELAEANKDHSSALMFHAHEMRCKRKHSNKNGAWLIDFLFDKFSNYGQSVATPSWWLFWTYYLSTLIYFKQVHSENSLTEYASFLACALFSASQVFSFLPSTKSVQNRAIQLFTDGSKDAVIPDSIQALAITQNFISVILIFLIILALRNRFRI